MFGYQNKFITHSFSPELGNVLATIPKRLGWPVFESAIRRVLHSYQPRRYDGKPRRADNDNGSWISDRVKVNSCIGGLNGQISYLTA